MGGVRKVNRILTPLNELNERLSKLINSLEGSPSSGRNSSGRHGMPRSFDGRNGAQALSPVYAFDDLLERLRLEASLFKSEDSPFTQRRRERERERARRLAEARALAEVQFERMTRERELAERKALAEREAAQREAAQRSVERIALASSLLRSPQDEDWEGSIEYTHDRSTRENQVTTELTITPDDSLFMDQPFSLKEEDELSSFQESRSERAQVTTPPQPLVEVSAFSPTLIRNILLGLLPPKPRIDERARLFYREPTQGAILRVEPWDLKHEILWDEVSYKMIREELGDLMSLSLAPRAFSPASPSARRTVTLRLKSTPDELDELSSTPIRTDGYDGVIPAEDEFNLEDFEEHRDPELYHMHTAYQELERQVDEYHLNQAPLLVSNERAEPSLDHFDEIDDEDLSLTIEPEFDFSSDPQVLRASVDPAVLAVADPFTEDGDLSFDADHLVNEFDWEGDTPTSIFGDEATPTDVFGEEIPDRDFPRVDVSDSEKSGSRERGLISRFFGRR